MDVIIMLLMIILLYLILEVKFALKKVNRRVRELEHSAKSRVREDEDAKMKDEDERTRRIADFLREDN